MKLSDWLQKPGQKRTQEEFGLQVGLTQGRISQIVQNGTSDLRTALAIEAATDGEVTLAELMMKRKTPAAAPLNGDAA